MSILLRFINGWPHFLTFIGMSQGTLGEGTLGEGTCHVGIHLPQLHTLVLLSLSSKPSLCSSESDTESPVTNSDCPCMLAQITLELEIHKAFWHDLSKICNSVSFD